MKNLNKIQITASPVQALNKIKRARIPVYACSKNGAYFTFEVADNYIKKVFAIFAHPCYNITIREKSPKKRLLKALISRPVIVIGCAAFAVCAALSNGFILKISVTGAGSYLKNEVLAIAYGCGVKPYGFYKGVDEPLLCAGVMALPDVTFCSVTKSGSVLYIDVQTAEEGGKTAAYTPMCADVNGTISAIYAVCGTALVTAGQTVAKGDTLIGAYYISGEQVVPCLAAGYAQITAAASVSVFFDCASEENASSAYSAVMLYAGGDEILSRDIVVKTVADGVIYTVNFTYLHTISINFD